MKPTRYSIRVLATLTLWAGFGLSASAQLPAITVEKAFEVKPRQADVVLPAVTEPGKHRVDPIPNPNSPGSTMGYVVRDAAGRPVRQFVSYDNKSYNIVAFYVNGQEAYREVFPPSPTEAHQFRWLGGNGGKWGLDRDRDGRVDEWVVISPEEASEELFRAIVNRDAKRLEALLPTKKNLDDLKLPPAEAERIRKKTADAARRLTETVEALKLSPDAKWIHLELGIPQTTPADAFGGTDDEVVYKSGTVLIEDKGKTLFVQTGEMLLVGRAWKLIEGPSAGTGTVAGGDDASGGAIAPEIADLVKKLDELDRQEPAPTTSEALAVYSGKRVEVLEQIVAKLPTAKQETWARLLIDSLAGAAEGGKTDSPALARLRVLRDNAARTGPANPLASYAAFRILGAENAIALANIKPGGDVQGVQDKWRAGLEEFVKAYPNSEDAGEAVLRLAVAYEFGGKDAESKAKGWYEHLTKNYPKHVHAAKAAGAIKRLESEGKPLELQGPTLSGQQFILGAVAGKTVVVYYWASWSTTLAEDAKKLKNLAETYGPKGLEIVTVCLDDDAKTAAQSLASIRLPGTCLHLPGGLDRSPLATGYGIMVVPHLFLVGKDGKVVSRNAQMTALDDDLKKMTQ